MLWRPPLGLSQASSAATARISLTYRTWSSVGPIARSASIAAGACSAATRYSLWISSPALGVNSARKCGRRSSQGPGTPSCRRHGVGRRVGQHVQGRLGGTGSQRLDVERRPAVVDPRLGPDLVDVVADVAGEEADAVGAAHEGVEVLEGRGPGQALVHGLHHVEGRHRVELERGDHAEGADGHDRRGEGLVAPADDLERPVGPDDLDGRDGGRQRGVARPRAVRAGLDGAGDGDVGQRRQVREGPAATLELDGEGRVRRARADPDGAGRLVELRRHVERLGRDEHAVGVGDEAERVARAQRLHATARGDDLAHLVDAGGAAQLARPVLDVAGPVVHGDSFDS